MCKSKIYKLKFDNVNNLTSGSGLTRFGITLSQQMQNDLQNKPCNVWVEFLQLTAVYGSSDIGTAHVALASTLNQRNTFNNTLNAQTNILCYFQSERLPITSTHSVIHIGFPSEKTEVISIPPVIDFWLCSAINQTAITLASDNYTWVCVLCFEPINEPL